MTHTLREHYSSQIKGKAGGFAAGNPGVIVVDAVIFGQEQCFVELKERIE